MTDSRTAERARIADDHMPIVLRDGIYCDHCDKRAMTRSEWAEHLAQALTPNIDEQITDTYLLAVGACIALIEATTTLAAAEESDRNARIITEWAAKVTTAMRRASATITPGSRP